MLEKIKYATIIDNKRKSHSQRIEMSNNNQHKYNSCHFSPTVISTDMCQNWHLFNLWIREYTEVIMALFPSYFLSFRLI